MTTYGHFILKTLCKMAAIKKNSAIKISANKLVQAIVKVNLSVRV